MKKVILVLLCIPASLSAQLSDNFESGTLSGWTENVPGRWNADNSSPVSGEFSLHHVFDNPDAGTDYAAFKTGTLHPDEANTSWSFIVRHGYEPSASNNWMVFLMAEEIPDKKISRGAYAIGVNIYGSDDSLRLVKISGNTITNVCCCGINWQTQVGIASPVKIVVQRSTTGSWSVEAYLLSGTLLKSSHGTDKEFFASNWFGVSYSYSSTKDRLLWIDDIMIDGLFYPDNISPSIDTLIVAGKNMIQLRLSEQTAPGTFSEAKISVNSNPAASLTQISPLTYMICFRENFRNKEENKFQITDLCDNSGNCSGTVERMFMPVWPVQGDLVITELMADPLPAVSLPATEYIEIINRTGFNMKSTGWEISDGDHIYYFPDSEIKPGYHILCHTSDTALVSGYGNTIGFDNFPDLTDNGKLLVLRDSTGMMIHGIEYSSDWHSSRMKSEGGWSLEMVDHNYPFFAEGNWTSSSSRSGGTPGSYNSSAGYNPDRTFEGLTDVFPVTPASISVSFSESIFQPEQLSNSLISSMKPFNIAETDPLFRTFLITLEEPLSISKTYELEIQGLFDIAGNPAENRKLLFGLPEAPGKGDLLFNEILFNPRPGGSDYIELINVSEKTVDASRLYLVSIDDTQRDTSGLYVISPVSRCIVPGEYFTITEDRESIRSEYCGTGEPVFEVKSLPSMPENKGHLLLLNRELELIDEVRYSSEMHYALVSNDEGISLEKVSPALSSADANNWHSASESACWGTPGKKNSVYTEFPQSASNVIFSSSRITPDSDGQEDHLVIHLNFPGTGNILNITVFDEKGNLVKELATNYLSGPEADILWDGTADDASQVSTGIYVILISYFNDAGETAKWKKICTVIR